MIRHIELNRLQPTVSDGLIVGRFAQKHQIMGKVPGSLAITAGKGQSPQ